MQPPPFREWGPPAESRSPSRSPPPSPGRTPPEARRSPPPKQRAAALDRDRRKKGKRRAKRRNEELERMVASEPSESGPSKEVFTSGNNILVSVSFNKNQRDGDGRPSSPEATTKKRKRKGEKVKRKKRKSKNAKDAENKKPVAIIDLERSPFKEMTPSPKAVIVLSDSDNCEKEEDLRRRQERIREELMEIGSPPPGEPVSAGPKTPPEPTVKFSIQTKSNPQLRQLNPLHEAEEEDDDNIEEPSNRQSDPKESHKGPNTPPDPPSSPDAYDPFEPTKSGSATPERPSTPAAQSKEDVEAEPGNAEKHDSSAEHPQKETKSVSPVEKVLSLLQSSRIAHSDGDNQAEAKNVSAENSQNTVSSATDIFSTIAKPNSPKPIYSTVAPTVVTSAPLAFPNAAPRMGIFTASPNQRNNQTNHRIVLPQTAKSSPLKTQAGKLFLTKPSPIKSTPIKPMPSKTIISKLPLPAIKPLPKKMNKNRMVQNGTEIIDLEDDEMDSPYSPGSSDFGDLFEPPIDTSNKHSARGEKASGKDIFDTLFGGKSNKARKTTNAMKVPVKQLKKSKGKNKGASKMDEDNLKVLDDLPSSAVEMQFLKKLNRQERVVDEVKLVLKPHYNKKHVTKEEYKEILRRAVPKICHNRSGEINPAKIQALVEAYVKKFRKKNAAR